MHAAWPLLFQLCAFASEKNQETNQLITRKIEYAGSLFVHISCNIKKNTSSIQGGIKLQTC
jgi:hypothetical protein